MKKHLVKLTEAERATLDVFTRTGQRGAQSLTRARVLLLADEQGAARNDADIARTLEINVHTVEDVRKRYCEQGLESVLNRKARKDKGLPVKIDGRVEAQLVALACSETPNGEPSWTLSMLADQLVKLEVVERISRESVRKTLKKTSLNRT